MYGLGGDETAADPEIMEWDENWDATGWDDEDVNDDFIRLLQEELEKFRNIQNTDTPQQPAG